MSGLELISALATGTAAPKTREGVAAKNCLRVGKVRRSVSSWSSDLGCFVGFGDCSVLVATSRLRLLLPVGSPGMQESLLYARCNLNACRFLPCDTVPTES